MLDGSIMHSYQDRVRKRSQKVDLQTKLPSEISEDVTCGLT